MPPIPPPPPPSFPPSSSGFKKKLKVHRDILDYYKTGTPDAPIQDQIRLLAMRGAMARAGGVRVADKNKTPEELGTPFYLDNYRPSEQARYLEEAQKFLTEGFSYATPKDGSIFWSGVDKNKLKGKVNNEFNKGGPGQKFGQLEATTDARFMDDAFVYQGSVKSYWAGASEEYGKAALGHVTAVQVFGLKTETIFWKDELKAILDGMNARLEAGAVPDVIDITIVVLEPVGSNLSYQFFTNLEIGHAPFYKAKPQFAPYPKNRDQCDRSGVVGHAAFPYKVREFWASRGQVKPSPAAERIAKDPSAVRYG